MKTEDHTTPSPLFLSPSPAETEPSQSIYTISPTDKVGPSSRRFPIRCRVGRASGWWRGSCSPCLPCSFASPRPARARILPCRRCPCRCGAGIPSCRWSPRACRGIPQRRADQRSIRRCPWRLRPWPGSSCPSWWPTRCPRARTG